MASQQVQPTHYWWKMKPWMTSYYNPTYIFQHNNDARADVCETVATQVAIFTFPPAACWTQYSFYCRTMVILSQITGNPSLSNGIKLGMSTAQTKGAFSGLKWKMLALNNWRKNRKWKEYKYSKRNRKRTKWADRQLKQKKPRRPMFTSSSKKHSCTFLSTSEDKRQFPQVLMAFSAWNFFCSSAGQEQFDCFVCEEKVLCTFRG